MPSSTCAGGLYLYPESHLELQLARRLVTVNLSPGFPYIRILLRAVRFYPACTVRICHLKSLSLSCVNCLPVTHPVSVTILKMGTSFAGSPVSLSQSSLFNKPLSSAKIVSKSPRVFLSRGFDPTSRKSNPCRFSISCSAINRQSVIRASNVSEKVQRLGFEFKSLPEPIDRVKRLLHYASLLPPFDESARIQENRVLGCTAQVWLDVKMDGNWVVKFRVDSDSEIMKGFCSCLIWVLDGAEAEEALSVNADDFVEMNVGLPSRGSSRVKTWHNVLISMQRRTKDLVLERSREDHQSLEAFASLVETNDDSLLASVWRNRTLRR